MIGGKFPMKPGGRHTCPTFNFFNKILGFFQTTPLSSRCNFIATIFLPLRRASAISGATLMQGSNRILAC
jgi:hypothetical protein